MRQTYSLNLSQALYPVDCSQHLKKLPKKLDVHPNSSRYRRFWPIPNIPYVLITRLKSFAKWRRKGTLLGANFNRASISLEELFSTSWLLWVGWVSYRENWQKLQAQCLMILMEPSIFLLSWFFSQDITGHQPSRLTLDQNYFTYLYFLMFSPCFHHASGTVSLHPITSELDTASRNASPTRKSFCRHRVTGTVALRLQWLLLLRLFSIRPPHCISGVPSSLTQRLYTFYTSLESWQCVQIHQSKGVRKKKKAADRNPKNTLLRVIPPTDIFRHLIWRGLFWHYALTRYPTLDLTYLNIFWHSIWHFIYFIWHSRTCAIWHLWHSVRVAQRACELATLCPETRGGRVC